jgi:hypothetical protein
LSVGFALRVRCRSALAHNQRAKRNQPTTDNAREAR